MNHAKLKPIYLDHAATTPVSPRVLEAMLPYFTEDFYNPSAMYAAAQHCRATVDGSRKRVAGVLGCRPAEVIFTSGGTESDNAAVKGAAWALRRHGNHIITTEFEHHAVLHTCHQLEKQGFEVTYLPVDRHGLVSVADVEHAITPQTTVVSVILANNEIGVVQPVGEIARAVKAKAKVLGTQIVVHTDAVQAASYLDLTVDHLGVDALSLSAHKYNGPKGVGVLYLRRATPFEPQQVGGSHERNHRAGTENVPGIIGAATALEIAAEDRDATVEHCTALRDRLIHGLQERIHGAHLNGHPTLRLANNVNISFEGTDAQWTLMAMDDAGIAASPGSACRTASLEPSHVLIAIGIPANLAIGTVRMTLGAENTVAEIDRVIEVMPGIIEKVRGATAVGAATANMEVPPA